MTIRHLYHRPGRRLLLVLLSCFLCLPPLALDATSRVSEAEAAATITPGFYEETVATATAYQTTTFAFLPGGAILIAEKSGIIRLHRDKKLLHTPLLDIRERVNQYGDRGLLGLAVDPDFAAGAPYIYLAYTYEHIRDDNPSNDNARKTARISRFTVTGDVADPNSEKIILGNVTPVSGTCNDDPLADCVPSDSPFHSVGNIKFAPDGSLFVTVGDSGDNRVNDNTLRAQNLDSLAGKVLRVNKDGTGWSGNPFYTNPAANRSKVWAYGVRNAFRFNLRPGTDLPYLSDVGWSAWEEINVAQRGANLGWPCYEGNAQQPGYAVKPSCVALYDQGPEAVQHPLVQWPHDGQGASVTGGAFYTGTSYPEGYRGAYFYGDYARGFLRSLRVDAANALVPRSVADFATDVDGPVDIEVGPDGDLYYLAIVTGQINRLRYGTPPPPPPVVTGFLSDQQWAVASNGYGPVERDTSNGEAAASDGTPLKIGGVVYTKGLGVHAPSAITYALADGCDVFSAQVGVDDEVGARGSVTFQVWSGETKLYESAVLTGADPAAAVSVWMAGRAELRLVVTDGGDGNSYDHADWANAQCGPNTPPVVTIDAPTVGTYRIGDKIAYAGGATDPDGGPPPVLTWQLITQHCPGGACHAHPTALAGTRGEFTVDDHDDETHLELLLTATDNGGLKTTESVRLDPQQAPLTLNTSPANLNVIYGSKAPVPTVVQQIDIGGKRTVTAPSPQILNGTSYRFSHWSDGEASAQRTITMGAGGATYTAIFTAVGVPSPSPSTPPSPSGSPASVPSFADVPTDYWAYPQIAQFAQRAITTGCGDDDQGRRLYCPERGVTRAEMGVFITRTLGQDQIAPPTTPTFADVPTDYWAYAQIERFAQLGITTGCGVNELGQRIFCPDRGVTRAEMAVFLDRAKGQAELNSSPPTFADVSADYWAYGWIERFFTLGITTGCGTDEVGNRVYCPDRGVTRAEMAVLIIRAYP